MADALGSMAEKQALRRRRRLIAAAWLAVAFVTVGGYLGFVVTALSCLGDEPHGAVICERRVVVNVVAPLSPLLPVLAMIACGVAGVRRRSRSLIVAAALVLGPVAAVGIPLFWLNV